MPDRSPGPFALHFLLHSANLLEGRLRRRLDEIGIGPRQARVIDALHRMGTASQSDLAREFAVTPAAMSTMTVRLVEAGHIRRDPHPDEARSNVLSLTDRGRNLVAEIYEAWTDMDRLIAARLGPEKAEALAKLTRELRDALGGRVPGARDAPIDPTNTDEPGTS